MSTGMFEYTANSNIGLTVETFFDLKLKTWFCQKGLQTTKVNRKLFL